MSAPASMTDNARRMVDICAARLSRAEMGEVGLAAMNYPQAFTRALQVHAGVVFEESEFAKLLLSVARDVNQRKGIAS